MRATIEATGKRSVSVEFGLLESARTDSCGPDGAIASDTDSSVTRAPELSAALFTRPRIARGVSDEPTVRATGPECFCAALASASSFSLISRCCRPGATYR